MRRARPGLSLALDEDRSDRRVRGLVDEDRRAGRAVRPISIREDRLGKGKADTTDVVGYKRRRVPAALERIDIEPRDHLGRHRPNHPTRMGKSIAPADREWDVAKPADECIKLAGRG